MGCQENNRRKERNESMWEKKTKEGIEEKYYGPSTIHPIGIHEMT